MQSKSAFCAARKESERARMLHTFHVCSVSHLTDEPQIAISRSDFVLYRTNRAQQRIVV